jgi:hypothetical protein
VVETVYRFGSGVMRSGAAYGRRAGIKYIGSSSGVNSATVPAHQAGDLILCFGFRAGSNSPPTPPGSSGSPWTWLDFFSPVLDDNVSGMMAYQLATDSNTVSGTWTNADGLLVSVYRGLRAIAPIGTYWHRSDVGTTLTYPAISLNPFNGTSWVVGFAGTVALDAAPSTPPSGMRNRIDYANASCRLAGHDTDAGMLEWLQQTANIGGTSAAWLAAVCELRRENF